MRGDRKRCQGQVLPRFPASAVTRRVTLVEVMSANPGDDGADGACRRMLSSGFLLADAVSASSLTRPNHLANWQKR